MPTSGRQRMVAEDDVARRVWAAMCDLVLDNERRREVSEAVGISFGRLRALRRIARQSMTMGELAANLGIDAPYATLVVDDLEKQKLVERGPHPTDRRAKLVKATPLGASMAKQAEEIMGRPPPGLTSLSKVDLDAIARGLEQALDADMAKG